MKKFLSIREAFDWWINNQYPFLPPDMKKGRPVAAWRDYTFKQGISEQRMREIMEEFGNAEIKISVTFR